MSHGVSDLLISGKSATALYDEAHWTPEEIKESLNAMLQAKGVVMFRASPSDKARLVKVIKKYRPEISTLAIGDGGNDVNMIQ